SYVLQHKPSSLRLIRQTGQLPEIPDCLADTAFPQQAMEARSEQRPRHQKESELSCHLEREGGPCSPTERQNRKRNALEVIAPDHPLLVEAIGMDHVLYPHARHIKHLAAIPTNGGAKFRLLAANQIVAASSKTLGKTALAEHASAIRSVCSQRMVPTREGP